jgi:uncharacterized OB-fold protein
MSGANRETDGEGSEIRERPAPQPTELSEGFWEGVRRGELVAQCCSDCRRLRHYPQAMCPDCHSLAFEWTPLSGLGSIYSYTVAHRAFHPAWREHVPYVLATIELDEGVRMICDLLDVEPEAVSIGQRVEVYFAKMPGQGMMPRFRVLESS